MINSCFDTFGDLRSEEENIFLTSTRGKYQRAQPGGGGEWNPPPLHLVQNPSVWPLRI